MQCPVCQKDTQRVFQKYGFWIRGCQSCDYRFAELETVKNHVNKIYGDDYFFGDTDGYSDYLSEEETITDHGRQYGQLLMKYMSPGEVLDVGSAAGFILKGLQESGWKGKGIEPNLKLADFSNTRFHIEVENTTLEQFKDGRQYNLISMIQVIAHFYDLRKAMHAAAEHTKPSGYWLIETWNLASFVSRLFGKHWHEYSPPSVLQWFSIDGLRQLAEQYNFTEIAHGRPSKRLNGRHFKSVMGYMLKDKPLSRPIRPLFNLVPDHWILPYPAFDLFWILFKKR